MYQDLQKQESFLDDVFDNLPSIAFVKDAKDLKYLRFNKAGKEILGFPEQQCIGKTDYDLFPKKEAEYFINRDKEILKHKKLIDTPEETVHTILGENF